MTIKKVKMILDRLIQIKKAEKIKYDGPDHDYDTAYKAGFISALELLKEEVLSK